MSLSAVVWRQFATQVLGEVMLVIVMSQVM